MGRGRVELKRIENKVNQQVTFSKRRSGLLKKAREISVLCDADVGLIIFSTKGKLSEYATDSSMERILQRYERYSYAERQMGAPDLQTPGSWNAENAKLKDRLEVLQRNERHYMGDNLEVLGMKELQSLENQLDASLRKLRSRKNNLMNDSISQLQKKDKALQEQNNSLAKKIEENAKESAQTTPTEQQNHNTNNTSCSDLLRPLSSLNVGESHQVSGENSEEVIRYGNDQSCDPVTTPWMLHHMQGM